MIDILVVWTPASVVSALVGGLGLGIVASIFDRGELTLRNVLLTVLALGIPPVLVFWAGQFYDTVTSDNGSVLGLRVLSRGLLNLVFILMVALGALVGCWNKRRSETS